MSNTTNFKEIREIAKLAQGLLEGKEFFLGNVVDQLAKVAAKHPHDQAVRNMHLIMQRRANKEGNAGIITQAEVQSLYDGLAGLGNSAVFHEELGGLLERAPEKVANRQDSALRGSGGEELDIVDHKEVNQLQAMWGGPTDNNVIKGAFVENGRRGVRIELESLGFSNPTVEVAKRDDSFVVYAAEVDSRRGRVPFLIPAEIKLGSVLMPSVFVSGNQFVDLTPENLRAHVHNAHSLEKHASPNSVIEHLNSLVQPKGVAKTASDAEDPGHVHYEMPGFLTFAEKDEGPGPIDVQQPKVEMPDALAGFAQNIEQTLVESGLSFPREAVVAAKTTVANELNIAGIAHDRVTVASEFKGGIVVATNVSGKGGKKRIEIPVEIVNGKPLMPSGFTSGAMAGPFTEESLRSFADKSDGEGFDPMLNDKYGMKYAELHKLALQKAAYGDFIEATEILAIINDKFGHEFHRKAHDDVMQLMRIGYGEAEKPLTAMERFAEEAAEKAASDDYQMSITNNPMLFYPQE